MSQGIPIAFAIVGCICIILLKGINPGLVILGTSPYTWASVGSLLPIPLFILMGQFVYHSGISSELYSAAGMNSYVVHGVTKVPLEEVFRGAVPFFLMLLACLILLYAFPQISLFLPNIMD